MRTRHTTLIVAISAALLTSGALSAQVKEGESDFQPADPSRSLSDLPGIECTQSSGTGCPVAIPDGGQPAVSQFTISDCGGVITDVNVGMQITHTWVGDLVVTVVAPDATEVILYNQPGCSFNNIFAVADDAAAIAMDTVCTNGDPSIDGTYRPSNPLAALNGGSGNGVWSLKVQDKVVSDAGTLNNWSLDLTCGEAQARATFEVNKVFTDDNPQEVDVTLSCFTGLPLVQSQSISQSQNVTFVVESYTDGELDCDITEEPVPGYSASYAASSPGSDDAEGCHYDDLAFSSTTECTITNTPDPVEVTVNKDWVIDGSGGNAVDPAYSLLLVCESQIIGGEDCTNPVLEGGNKNYGYYGSCYSYSGSWIKVLTEYGTGDTDDASYTAGVIPDWDGGSDCYVEEDVYDSSVEVDGYDCGYNGNPGLHVNLGGEDGGGSEKDECTITNTVFFEGIPTLSQYGMAIMALLMLGVGFVGFRRFV